MAVRAYIQPFMERDRHGAEYPVCSLYLDGPDLQLFQHGMEGWKTRFKLRVRTYTEDPDDWAFFEVKKRRDQIVAKTRVATDRELAQEWLNGGLVTSHGEFGQLARKLYARPVLRVRFFREAWESQGVDPVRVTFDRKLEFAPTDGPDLSHNGQGWAPAPVEGTILEVKFTNRFPAWVSGMIQRFDLQRKSVSKYCRSMAMIVAHGGDD